MYRILGDDVGEDDFIFLLFRLDLAPIRRSDSIQESFDQLLFGRVTETPASEMFDDHIDIGAVDGTESHWECLLVNGRIWHGYVIGVVEMVDDAVDEVFYRTIILAYKFVHDLEWLELVVCVVLPSPCCNNHGNCERYCCRSLRI